MVRPLVAGVVGLVLLLSAIVSAATDTAVVVTRLRGCDYFIADGALGYYVLEWYGGYDPSRGDIVSGDIAGYGFKDVSYTNVKRSGRVWVEDYFLSRSRALEKMADKCD